MIKGYKLVGIICRSICEPKTQIIDSKGNHKTPKKKSIED